MKRIYIFLCLSLFMSESCLAQEKIQSLTLYQRAQKIKSYIVKHKKVFITLALVCAAGRIAFLCFRKSTSTPQRGPIPKIPNHATKTPIVTEEAREAGADLIQQIRSKNWADAKKLIDSGAHVDTIIIGERYNTNWQNKTDHEEGEVTPLTEAIFQGNAEMVAYLINKGADVNLKSHGTYPLNFAILEKRKDITKILIQNGANVDACDVIHYSHHLQSPPLLSIIEDINLIEEWQDVIALLIKYGANINARSLYDDDQTPLHHAVRESQTKLVQLLVDNGADLYAKDRSNRTVFDYFGNDGEIFDILEKAKKKNPPPRKPITVRGIWDTLNEHTTSAYNYVLGKD